MSLLWSDQIRIGLSPRRVELARISRGFRTRTVAGESVRDCQPQAGQEAWAAALDTLDVLLAELPPGRAQVSVVLSNHFVRYVVLPWEPELGKAAEIAIAAVQRFTHMFGEVARAWDVRYAQGEYGQPGIACAIDAELLTNLDERINRGSLRLVSVQPLLMNAFNALRDELDPGGALAVVEPGRVCLGVFRDGQWQSVVSRRSGAGDPVRLIARELAVAAPDLPPIRLDLLDFGTGCQWSPGDALPAHVHALPAGQECQLALYGSV